MIHRYLNWRFVFVLIAVMIAIASLYYANILTRELAREEKKRIETVARAIELAGQNPNESEMKLAIEIISANTTIPLILADSNDLVINHNNIKLPEDADEYLNNKLREFKRLNAPITVNINEQSSQFVYYGESYLMQQLRLFPYILLGILFLFIVLLIYFISYSNRYIQDKVWIGMSKETAHQLGTPISSLVAWLEILQEEEEKEIYREMKKDVDRLSLIANRFSKIGSSPTLEEIEIVPVLQGAIEYMRQRAPKKVDIVLQSDLRFFDKAIFNPSLFEWVLENLIRNSLDAMSGKGFIHIHAFRVAQTIVIDLTDNGKGIPKKYWQKIFNPGYSTKKRGWGLGLSLAHRIIKDYHKGDIFVTQSEQNKGTTFRIILNTW